MKAKMMQHKESEGWREEEEESKSSRNSAGGVGKGGHMAPGQGTSRAVVALPQGNSPSSKSHQSSPFWLLLTFPQPCWDTQNGSRGG